jgi:hypothetical protein
MVKCLSFNDVAREAASRATRASPYVGSHDGLICEHAEMIVLEWSLQTAT